MGAFAKPAVWYSPIMNAADQGLVPSNVVTFALRRAGATSPNLAGGTVTLGGVDTTNCGPVQTYIKAGVDDPALVKLEAVLFGTLQAVPPTNVQWTAKVDLVSR